MVRRLRDLGLRNYCLRKFKKKNHDLYYEKGRQFLGEQLDIVRVLQQLRLFELLVNVKLSLNYDERQFVENNRFKKLQISDSSSSSDDTERGLKETLRSLRHEQDASDLFSKSR